MCETYAFETYASVPKFFLGRGSSELISVRLSLKSKLFDRHPKAFLVNDFNDYSLLLRIFETVQAFQVIF